MIDQEQRNLEEFRAHVRKNPEYYCAGGNYYWSYVSNLERGNHKRALFKLKLAAKEGHRVAKTKLLMKEMCK